MKDYPLSFDQLNSFSKNLPYKSNLDADLSVLFSELKKYEKKLNFPAIRDDIGQMINFFFKFHRPKIIFEFGSGYGQSCFWYFVNNNFIQQVTLTEKRTDLEDVYNSLPWNKSWKEKITYVQGDAFEVFRKQQNLDFVLIDGVKADYLDFLKACESRMSDNGVVLIDNSYWRGSFLDPDIVEKKYTAKQIKKLHDYIDASKSWDAIFIPYEDGVTMLRYLS